jgi:tetratricopeptide (TPR) repeat protein
MPRRYRVGLLSVLWIASAGSSVAPAQEIPLGRLSDWTMENDAGWRSLNKGDYAKAEEHFKIAIKDILPYYPKSERLLARSYCDLARVLYHQKRFADAEPLAQWALAVREADPKTGEDVLFQCVYVLGLIHLAEDHFGEAEPLLKRALAYQEANLGADHVNVLTTLDKLTEAYFEQRKFVDAEKLLLRAIAIHERKTPDENLALAATADRLAVLLAKLDRGTEAEKWKARALKIRDTVATKAARERADRPNSKFQSFK